MSAQFGFPKDRRLLARADYQRVQGAGARVPTAHFVLILTKTPDQSQLPSRLGITASRRVGNSVRRSRLKRLVREAFRLNPRLIPAGYDLVVICRKDDLTLGLGDVQREFDDAKKRIGGALGYLDKKGSAPNPNRGRPPKKKQKYAPSPAAGKPTS